MELVLCRGWCRRARLLGVAGQPRIERAGDSDRRAIERLRHAVYATELCQFPEQPDGVLPEDDWADRIYITARAGGELAGFVAITPPWAPRYGIERRLDVPMWSGEGSLHGGRSFDAIGVGFDTLDNRPPHRGRPRGGTALSSRRPPANTDGT